MNIVLIPWPFSSFMNFVHDLKLKGFFLNAWNIFFWLSNIHRYWINDYLSCWIQEPLTKLLLFIYWLKVQILCKLSYETLTIHDNFIVFKINLKVNQWIRHVILFWSICYFILNSLNSCWQKMYRIIIIRSKKGDN